MNGFQVFSLTIAIRNHFSLDSYDFFRYNGKVNVSRDKFEQRKDRFHFNKLSHIYREGEILDLLVANFRENPKIWALELLEKPAKDRLLKMVGLRQRIAYAFGNELQILFGKSSNPFKIRGGQNPDILTCFYREEISYETFIILDDLIGFSGKFESLDDQILWRKKTQLINKYKPFFTYDKERMKTIFVDFVKENVVMGNSTESTNTKDTTDELQRRS